MLWKWCTQYASKFVKLSSGPRTGKGQFSFQSQRKEMQKQCSNYCTIALISHASKVMLKILQARLQQYMSHELPDCSSWIHKRQRNQRSNCQHPLDHWKSKRFPEKRLLLYWLNIKSFYKLKTRYPMSRNLELLYVWVDARVWAHWNHSFDMHLTYLESVFSFHILSSSGLAIWSGCSLMADINR